MVNTGAALGGAGPNAVLCKTCSVFLCVLEQPRVDNSSAESIGRDVQLGSINLWPDLSVYSYTITLKSISDHLYNFLNWTARIVHVRKYK